MKRTRNLKVKKLSQLSPNMLRLTFTSKDLLDFPENEEGGYIKFLFTNKNEKNNEKLVRPYTIRNFRKKPDKIDNIKYILTPKGIAERTKLTINFMKRKMEEYDELKRELTKNNVDNS